MKDKIPVSVISALFVLLVLALFYNQIIRYPYYSRLSKNNSIRIVPIEGPRGNIFDRNGKPMVTSRLSFDVAIIYQELRDLPKLKNLLERVLGMSDDEIDRSLHKALARPYAPVTIAEDVDKDKAITLEEASMDVSGIVIQTRSKRNYLYNQIGSHVFGYLGEITEEELEGLKDYGYRMRDLIGRDGIEKYYDSSLRGVDGGTQIEVDSRGHQTRVLGLKEPSAGKDLYLTIDAQFQSFCDKLLGENNGAIIVIDPNDGAVLALVSHPEFDPNIFIKPDTTSQRANLLTDNAGRPLSNRAISGLYPPGSVFKVVTASSALNTKRITPSTRFFCPGSYRLGKAKFDCWKEGGHGSQNITGGLMNSCNVFFYNTGRAVGPDLIEAFAKLFGFGRLTGIDLPDEVKGIVPGRVWKRIHKNDNWYEGETLNYAIGQGYLLVTPIQVLDMMAVMANSGSLVKPYLVKRTRPNDRSVGRVGNSDISAAKPRSIGLKESTIREVRKGLFEVVNNENGTGKRAKIEGAVVAGKTGTAQNPQGKTHAWFAGFAPYEGARICVVVFLEHGGKGGLGAAELAHGIFEEAKRKGYI